MDETSLHCCTISCKILLKDAHTVEKELNKKCQLYNMLLIIMSAFNVVKNMCKFTFEDYQLFKPEYNMK